jgi:hypothetical protein
MIYLTINVHTSHQFSDKINDNDAGVSELTIFGEEHEEEARRFLMNNSLVCLLKVLEK